MSIRIADLWFICGAYAVISVAQSLIFELSTPEKVSASVSAVIAVALLATFRAWRERGS